MTSHNPLRPKSSLLEQKAKSRSGLQMVMIIVAVHVVFLGGLLFSGCRPEKPTPEPAPGPDPQERPSTRKLVEGGCGVGRHRWVICEGVRDPLAFQELHESLHLVQVALLGAEGEPPLPGQVAAIGDDMLLQRMRHG